MKSMRRTTTRSRLNLLFTVEKEKMNKLSWYLNGIGAYGKRYGLMAIIIKAFYYLHLISEQDAIGYARGLHNMWMVEKAGLRVAKVELGR